MRATHALVHLENLRHNITLIRKHTGGPMVCLAVKADAYGHGIAAIGREAQATGVEYLAVATVDEAAELRDAGITVPVLLYSLPVPEEFPEIVARNATPIITDLELADNLEHEAARQGRQINVHLKIDTGMGRIGCTPQEAAGLCTDLAAREHLTLAGVSTHFAVSDTTDRSFTLAQIDRFKMALAEIRARGVNPGIVHAGNSGGVLSYPEAWFDMVRPGILAYGYFPSAESPREMDIRPVMDLRSRVVFIKEVEPGATVSYGATWTAERRTHIGTIPVGYGDGYNRMLSNAGRVAIGSESYPIVGRVCMDQIMVDLGPECRVRRYDEAILFGPQDGAPDAEELAGLCGTIPYEITCALSKRVPRIYVD